MNALLLLHGPDIHSPAEEANMSSMLVEQVLVLLVMEGEPARDRVKD